jgi:hypothetical protein
MFDKDAGFAEPSGFSPAELVDRIGALERQSRVLAAEQLAAIAGFDTAQRAADQAGGVGGRLVGRTVGVQVALTLGISAAAGVGRVAFARSLVDEHPALLRLAAEGLLGEWHLRTVVAATAELRPEHKQVVARQLAVEVRARASRGVKQLTPHELGGAAARRAIGIDPEAATRRYERARRHREVSVTQKVNGAAALWVKGPAEQTLHMYDQVERDARARRHDGDERSLDAIMYDHIYESILASMPVAGPDPRPTPDPAGSVEAAGSGVSSCDLDDPGPDDPAQDSYAADPAPDLSPPRRPWVPRRRWVEAQVVMSASTLVGLDEQPALLRGYGAIPAEIARQIADTSSDDPARVQLRRLFCEPTDGRLVQMETRARLFTGPLRQFVLFRDQCCRLTGGRIRDLDHIVERARGGPTSAHNGESLAKNPHVLRDRPDLAARTRLDRPPEDPLRVNAPVIEWTFPTGHTYRSEPPPVLGHGSMPTAITAPRPPPPPSEQEQDAALARRKEQILRAIEHRRALHERRLATPSAMERALYLALYMDPKFKGG